MWVELGIFGILTFLSLIVFIIKTLLKKIRSLADWHDFDVGLLAGLISFLIMNITSPVLSHIFGIIYIIFVLTIAMKNQPNLIEKLIDLLYRIFNRLHLSNN